MKKNLRSCIEQPVYGEKFELLNPGDPAVAQAAGVLPDINDAKTALWKFSEASRVRFPLDAKTLSPYRYLTFSVWAVSASGGTFSLRLESDEKLGGESGYCCLLPITHNGWNDYRIELPFSGVQGDPLGWDFIRAVVLDCNIGGQTNRRETVLSVGQIFLWNGDAPQLYVKRPELKGAAIFSKTGAYSIVDRKRIAIAPDGNLQVKPFEENGVLWLPMAPLAAVLGRRAVADDRDGDAVRLAQVKRELDLVDALRREKHVRLAADMKARVPAHRLVKEDGSETVKESTIHRITKLNVQCTMTNEACAAGGGNSMPSESAAVKIARRSEPLAILGTANETMHNECRFSAEPKIILNYEF